MTLALRSIPVSEPHPVQLVLGLPMPDPIERLPVIAPDPEPVAAAVQKEIAA